jgi:hypothetical protein
MIALECICRALSPETSTNFPISSNVGARSQSKPYRNRMMDFSFLLNLLRAFSILCSLSCLMANNSGLSSSGPDKTSCIKDQPEVHEVVLKHKILVSHQPFWPFYHLKEELEKVEKLKP